jgi:hypothetical protein
MILYTIILVHFAVIILNFLALIFLSVELFDIESDYDWFICLPLITLILSLLSSRDGCFLTRIENKIRKKQGKPQIKAFIKHYIINFLIKNKNNP